MAETEIDLGSWHRRETFALFRSYGAPHYALTSRLDVTHLMQQAKPRGVSPYRACLYAIGAGMHAIPDLLVRFRGDRVVQHDTVALSMTVPLKHGGFGYAYVPYHAAFDTFDRESAALIAQVAAGETLQANTGERDDLVYLSCLPWLDFTAISNALPGPDDCIPRVSWGKFVDHGNRWDMAISVEVHHALIDGEHLGAFFAAAQEALDRV